MSGDVFQLDPDANPGQIKFQRTNLITFTLHATTEIAGKRQSKSRPEAGIVELIHRCYNHEDKLVAECRRSAFIRMRHA